MASFRSAAGNRLGVERPHFLRPGETSVTAVSWGRTELPPLLASLLELGLRVHGPVGVGEAMAFDPLPGAVLLLDLRAGSPAMAEIVALTRKGAPVAALADRDPGSISAAMLSGVAAVLTPPLTPELVAAQLRTLARFYDWREGSGHEGAGDLRVDTATRSVTWKGQPVKVTPTQFRVLAALCAQPGRVHSAIELAETALGYTITASDAAAIIKIHVRRIRVALDAVETGAGACVENVRGFGYRARMQAGETSETVRPDGAGAPPAQVVRLHRRASA